LLGLAASSPATAQSATAPSTSAAGQSANATEFYDKGVTAAVQGRWEEARTAFLEAWRLKQHWQIAVNLGQAELNVGKSRDAAEHLSYFLREATGIGPADRKHAEEMLAQARAKVGVLWISVNQPGAEIFVDGAVVGKAPLEGEVLVEPGARVVEARLQGVGAVKETREIAAGGEGKVDLYLASTPGKTRPAALLPGLNQNSATVGERPKKSFIIAGATAGAIAAAGGIGFAVASQIKKSASHDLEGLSAPCRAGADTSECKKQFDKLQTQKMTYAWSSIGSFVLAGAIGVGTVVYSLRSSPPAGTKKATGFDFFLSTDKIGATVTTSW